MNKLVSKNPVQRFKEGRKIIKAQKSWGEGFGIENSGKIFGPSNILGYENPNIGNNFSIGTSARFLGYNPPETQGNMLYNIPNSQEELKSSTNEVMDKSVSNEEPINNKIEKKDKKMQKKSINPNRFISIYDDKNRTWATHAADNKLTNRDQVRAFQRDVLKMGDSDGIWGKDTEKAYQDYLNSKKSPMTTFGTFDNNMVFTPKGKETIYNKEAVREQLIPKQEQPTFNLGTYVGSDPTRTYNAGNIRANRGNLYSNVDEYWNYLSNNKNSDDFQLFQNIMGTQDGNLNREAFNAIMANYGISGNLGKRDSGRLANLLNDLRAIGTEGSDARNAFLNSYKQSFDNVQTGVGNTIYDRSATRDWLRNNAGGSAYAFTGDQRKAVRNILNGQGTDQDKELIKGNSVLAKALTGYFKTGGNINKLPSRNIIERFKQRNFRIVAQ